MLLNFSPGNTGGSSSHPERKKTAKGINKYILSSRGLILITICLKFILAEINIILLKN
ncbi:MAG: hypothetical protein AMXMBFR49_21790 [Chlorobiota bacterium]